MASVLITNGSLGMDHSLLLSVKNEIYAFGTNDFCQCSIQDKSHNILIPHLLSKKEMNLNENVLIDEVIAGRCNTLIVINQQNTICEQ